MMAIEGILLVHLVKDLREVEMVKEGRQDERASLQPGLPGPGTGKAL